MVGEMNSAVSPVDFDRMLVDTSAAGGSVAGAKAEQQAFEALEPWEQREIMRLVGKFSHVLNEECEAFKRQVAAENEADDKGEGDTCDS